MATCLGDLFPDDYKQDYIGRAISPKKVIIIEVPEFYIEHEKFMVLITISADEKFMGCVPINTNPSPQGNHVIILANEHEYLNYNSHMSCTHIIPVEISYLKSLLDSEPERIKGEISDEQHIEILQKLRASKTITPIIKKQFNL